METEEGPSRYGAEQCSERAEGAAPKASDAHAGPEDDEEKNAQHETLRKVGLSEIEDGQLKRGMQECAEGFEGCDVAVLHRDEKSADGDIEAGKESETDGTNEEAEGIEGADYGRSEDGGDQARGQDSILDGLPAFVAVRFDTLFAAFRL